MKDGCPVYWGDVSGHLSLAASIVKVELNAIQQTGCEMVKVKELSECVAELARFNFIWNALEITVALIRPKNVPGNQIDVACQHLNGFYAKEPPLGFYGDALKALRNSLCDNNDYKALAKEFKLNEANSPSMGLQITRKLRNHLAQGTGTLPLFAQSRFPISPRINIVKLSSRILLFTIQHLALAVYRETDLSGQYGKDEDDLLCEVEADRFLKSLHIATADTSLDGQNQLSTAQNSFHNREQS